VADDRSEMEAARAAGLKARHETREARAVRKAVAEEIVRAIDAKNEACAGMTSEERDAGYHTGLTVATAIVREIGSRDPE
jgi:hypothetical protein